jgi:hypothetical protein
MVKTSWQPFEYWTQICSVFVNEFGIQMSGIQMITVNEIVGLVDLIEYVL